MIQMTDLKRYDDRSQELKEFLDNHSIGNLATCNGHIADLATVFFVRDKGILYFKSRTKSRHSLNVAHDQQASFTTYAHDSSYEAKYGVQLSGVVQRVLVPSEMTRLISLYEEKFAGSAAKLPSINELCSPDVQSTFYKFVIDQFKIIDESKQANRTMIDYHPFQS